MHARGAVTILACTNRGSSTDDGQDYLRYKQSTAENKTICGVHRRHPVRLHPSATASFVVPTSFRAVGMHRWLD